MTKKLFVTQFDSFNPDDYGMRVGHLLSLAEFGELVGLVVENASDAKANGEVAQAIATMLEELRVESFVPSLILLPTNWSIIQSLAIAGWQEDQGQGPFDSNFQGVIEEIPVIQWWLVPQNQIYAVDLLRFCHVDEGIEVDGSPTPPKITVDDIDDFLASEIISSNDSLEDLESEPNRRLQLLASVRTSILRPFSVEIDDIRAARSIRISPSELD